MIDFEKDCRSDDWVVRYFVAENPTCPEKIKVNFILEINYEH